MLPPPPSLPVFPRPRLVRSARQPRRTWEKTFLASLALAGNIVQQCEGRCCLEKQRLSYRECRPCRFTNSLKPHAYLPLPEQRDNPFPPEQDRLVFVPRDPGRRDKTAHWYCRA